MIKKANVVAVATALVVANALVIANAMKLAIESIEVNALTVATGAMMN